MWHDGCICLLLTSTNGNRCRLQLTGCFFPVRELSVHGTNWQPVSWRLPPSTPSRDDWTTAARMWKRPLHTLLHVTRYRYCEMTEVSCWWTASSTSVLTLSTTSRSGNSSLWNVFASSVCIRQHTSSNSRIVYAQSVLWRCGLGETGRPSGL